MREAYIARVSSGSRSSQSRVVAVSVSRTFDSQAAISTSVAILLCAVSLSLAIVSFATSVARGQDGADAPVVSNNLTPDGAAHRALGKKFTFDFEDTALENALEDLSKRCGVPIQIDARALEDVGLDGRFRVSLQAEDLSLRAGLAYLLDYWDLSWVVRGDSVVITTPEEAEMELELRTYNVRDLIRRDGSLGGLDMESMLLLIETTVSPCDWGNVGGPCSLAPFQELLIAWCTADMHRDIDGLLVGVRELKRQYAASVNIDSTDPTSREKIRDAELFAPISLSSTESDERIRAALEQEIAEVSFSDTPLDEVAAKLSELAGVPVIVDRRALEDVGLLGSPENATPPGENPFGDGPGAADPFGGGGDEPDPFGDTPGEADPFGVNPEQMNPFGGGADPFGQWLTGPSIHYCSASAELLVSYKGNDVTLRQVLNGMLEPLDLTWTARDEAIVITTPEACECSLKTCVYPVGDLILDSDGLGSPEYYELLIESVIADATRDTWDVVGGPGTIQPLHGLSALVVSQTEAVHPEVARALARLRRGRSGKPAEDVSEGQADDGMILRVYYLGRPQVQLDAPLVDDLLQIARDLATPRGMDESPTSYINKFGSAIVINHRAGIHREFARLLTKLKVDWRTSSEEEVFYSSPVVGQNGESPGGFFDVRAER